MPKGHYLQSLIAALLTTGLAASSSSTIADDKKGKDDTPKTEKCYGITKKGYNDCAANNHPCQGQSTKDNDPNEYLYVLEGTCQKIVNGTKK